MFFILFTFLLVGVLGEAIIRSFSLDIVVMLPLLYTVEGGYVYDGGKQIMEAVDDSRILYRIKNIKGAICKNCVHPKEKYLKMISYTFSGNNSRIIKSSKKGMRYKIFIIGGSYTFGVSTSDDLTVPNMIQQYLNQKNTEIEVIDRSASAYVTSQKVAIAENLLVQHGIPKAILFQWTNGGRRAFLYDEVHNKNTFIRHFHKNIELYRENFPNILNLPSHYNLVTSWSLYRLAIAFYYRWKILGGSEPCSLKEKWHCFPALEMQQKFSEYGDEHSSKIFNQFVKKWGRKTNIIVYVPTGSDCPSENLFQIENHIGYKKIVLCPKRPKKEYYETHPPTYVYEWYRKIYEKLIDQFVLGEHD